MTPPSAPPARWRRGLLAGAAVCAVLVSSGCGDTTTADPGPTSTASPAGAGTSANTAVNDADIAFARQMIPHHQSAVAMAELATGHVGDPRVADLAGRIQAAQQPEIDTLNHWLARWGKPMPSASGEAMEGMEHGEMAGIDELDVTALMNAKGTPWDKEFLAVMVKHHEAAVMMAQQELAQGANSDATTLAQKIITDQQAQITEMRQLRAQL
ncbi:uncharacterized protein (DUF305 family) [Actinoplanes octamycinicus]|uniref:Uncharacterized protein (DUF305 family) n=1 Tax=Actinoplanes octamycinicus TaxID=135948 RepID=A0A7W7H155_9ACTN|nr:DUF305 domain-containing protein [Actinoplanes octamycinicus]MBB4742070.1 uncharacterized protein (DUF305 family) [Actinoplanes octamycinicus]GIE63694.1 DUF305 domain-containing protein [Actinoplanes octamycinicus]